MNDSTKERQKTDSPAIPENIENLLRLAEGRLDKKDYQGAIKFYSKILAVTPDDAWTFWERGLAKKSKNDISGALEDFTKAISIEPDNSFFYYQRALIREKKGDHRGARDDFEKVEVLRSHVSDDEQKKYYVKDGTLYYTREKDGRSGIDY